MKCFRTLANQAKNRREYFLATGRALLKWAFNDTGTLYVAFPELTYPSPVK